MIIKNHIYRPKWHCFRKPTVCMFACSHSLRTMHPVSPRPAVPRPAVPRPVSLRRMSLPSTTTIKRFITTPASSVDILTASCACICTIRVLWLLLQFTSLTSFISFTFSSLWTSFNHCYLFVLYIYIIINNNINNNNFNLLLNGYGWLCFRLAHGLHRC